MIKQAYGTNQRLVPIYVTMTVGVIVIAYGEVHGGQACLSARYMCAKHVYWMQPLCNRLHATIMMGADMGYIVTKPLILVQDFAKRWMMHCSSLARLKL